LQWVQRITVEASDKGILPIPAPILSRVFQELSRGIVNLSNARKISELPFPFPYAQMITVSLIIHWIMMPVLMSILCHDWWWAGLLTFITVFSNWSINYVAQEIESPFGDDANDLPLVEIQMNFNRMLSTLIMQEAQEAPSFEFMAEHRRIQTSVMTSDDMEIDDLLELDKAGSRLLREQASFGAVIHSASNLVTPPTTPPITVSPKTSFSRRTKRHSQFTPQGTQVRTRFVSTVRELVERENSGIINSRDLPSSSTGTSALDFPTGNDRLSVPRTSSSGQSCISHFSDTSLAI